ncbi:hypothetical protein T12_1887 [Trichinella patagoniensis]|uniref:Uncharacterized protein n=1 Tax=Trichinella patagoniensis TaxID=990121 RepID=A0A0V0YP02_9BILA|nr:hypothetical protein T12_1887 [Trichinella patagoniensis]
MIQITLERKTQNSNAGPNKNELDVVIFLVALMPLVDSDRIKLITYKWRTNADIKERDVHCRENLKQL